MRFISALLAIATTVFTLGAVDLQADFEPTTLGAPPLEITQTGEIDNPGGGTYISQMFHHGKSFYLGTATDEGGLHCYSLPDYEYLWSVSLGRDTHANGQRHEAEPGAFAFSEDGSVLFMTAVSATSHIHKSLGLFAIDVSTGEILDRSEPKSNTLELHAGYVGDIPVLISVSPNSIRILPQDDLETELASHIEGLLPGDDQSTKYDRSRLIGNSVFSDDDDVLHCTMPKAGYLARFSITPKAGVLTLDASRTKIGVRSPALARVAEEIAVLDYHTGELNYYNAAVLEKTGLMQSAIDGFMEEHGGNLYVACYYRSDSSDYGARLQVIDPERGEVWSQSFFQASLSELSLLADGKLAIIDRGRRVEIGGKESRFEPVTYTTAHGALWLLDIETWEFIGEAPFPHGCSKVNFNGDTGGFVMVEYINEDVVDSPFPNTLKIMQIELP